MPVERLVSEWSMNETTREAIRACVLQKWASEKHGSATKYERYRYNVETLMDGSRIFLHRPAWKNKGCDFEVCCDPRIERADGTKKLRPAHTDLYAELNAIIDAHPKQKLAIQEAVERVWQCDAVDEVCQFLLPKLSGASWQLKAERALKIAKWLFVEQDITDWNTSGRAMLMNGIRENLNFS